ncbi:DNA primase [Xenorhabdus sp. 12]|uniref:DNA primase n=1 Tax=Xenorhabdus santafensis TaxID=2582833 RepID=A0ABU4S5V0_9GAMM|nr:DUF5710 domain-containing protein [Xenorhabdus sp. 12]MDX7985838.1 DNA primase [Xenorhabdus sp. 12]
MLRIDLNVPYDEKDEAKKLGARWDPVNKTWFIPNDIEPASFTKWIPFYNVQAPWWYIAQTKGHCWKCHEHTTLTAFMLPSGHKTLEADENSEIEGQTYWLEQRSPAFVFYIDDIPSTVRQNLSRVTHFLSKDFNQTTQTKYWMNHCEKCGAKQGDFHMHCEPGGEFFPTTIEEATAIQLHQINQPIMAACGDISHQHIHVTLGGSTDEMDQNICTSAEWINFMTIVSH